ncbi:hypothetical protein SAMN05421821_103311 [Mucilaginibacter lappiensis]|uniref:Uncharacterized protein n=1 Tax=Mucilaginibacter lappiensis TaxID=354630 RepID=A0ABR6PH26_9SPHI|nr:hypothetical protein [Mucilaginibacter lappiensis]SIQ74597.1 hypothetical protein SAMN05421821_103311 [Mucilaginibacter lappiensis]
MGVGGKRLESRDKSQESRKKKKTGHAELVSASHMLSMQHDS